MGLCQKANRNSCPETENKLHIYIKAKRRPSILRGHRQHARYFKLEISIRDVKDSEE